MAPPDLFPGSVPEPWVYNGDRSINGVSYYPPYLDLFLGSDGQTPSEELVFGGRLDGDGFLTIDWDEYIKTSSREIVTVSDGLRTKMREIYIRHDDITFEDAPYNQQWTETEVGVAIDDEYRTPPTDPFGEISISLSANDIFEDEYFATYPPIYEDLTGALSQYGTVSNWDPDTGSFQFDPDDGVDRLIMVPYTFQNPGITYWDYTNQILDPEEVSYIESNEAILYIQVGKAVRVNLSVSGLDEESEDTGYGALVAVNDDDDNENQIEDRDELIGPLSGEDDLTRIDVDVWLRDDAYETDYTGIFSVGAGMRLWTSASKSNEIINGEEFILSDLPSAVYAEGIQQGTGTIQLLVQGPSSSLYTDIVSPVFLEGQWVGQDTTDVDAVQLTAVQGNLTLEGVAEEDQDTIGGLIFYNDNDSNENDIEDLLDDVGRTEIDEDWVRLTVDPIAPVGLAGTYTLTFTGGVRIWRDNENGTFDYIQSGFTMDATATPNLYVEGFAEDSDDEITLSFTAVGATKSQKVDRIKVTSQRALLEWAKIADDQSNPDVFNRAQGRLEHTKAISRTKGAYIPLNNDDDDYNEQPDSNNTQTLSAQENDLLPVYVPKFPFVFKDPARHEMKYSLSKSDNLRLWTKNADGTFRVFSDDDIVFNLADELTFYVDAVDGADPLEWLKLTIDHWRDGMLVKGIEQQIFVNVFEIKGPLNVPDYSVYEYDVEGVVANRPGTMWVGPGSGDELSEPDPAPGDNIDAARLEWKISPRIAKARYQATLDYVWARDVNVVKIELTQGTLDDTGQNPVLTWEGSDADVPSTRIVQARSTANPPALTSTYHV
jgi:hypothetical protein